MKFIYNWMLSLWYTKKLREMKDVPYKLKIESDAIKSACILQVEQEIEPLWLSIKGLLYKLGIKSIQNLRVRIHREDIGKQAVATNPVFTANEIARIKVNYWLCLFLLLLFIVPEVFMYTLTAALFVQGAGAVVHFAVALMFTIGVMYGIGYGYDNHYKYREVMERSNRGELKEYELRKYRDMRIFGYILSFICIAAIIFSGLARMHYLEHIPKRGLSPERIASVIKASEMTSYFVLLFTLVLAFAMAMTKRDLSKANNRYRVYREWHKANTRLNAYTQELIKNSNMIIQLTEQCVEKNWQLIIDLKRNCKTKEEHDDKYAGLNAEYMQLKAKPGFAVTPDIYTKFSPIQCAHEELFKFGIWNAKEIKDKIDFALEVRKVPENHLKEHLKSHPDQNNEEVIQLYPLRASNGNGNGKVKETNHSLLNNTNNMKNIITIIAFAAIGMLASCKSEPTAPPVNVIALPDFSASRDQSIINWYKEQIAQTLIPSMGKKDGLAVLPIDFCSRTGSQEIFLVDFSKNNYENEFAGLQRDEIEQQNHNDSLQAAVKAFNKAFDASRQKRIGAIGGTDIFGALSQAKKYVAPGCRNVIVIFSDMIEGIDEKTWDFARLLNTPADVEHYLSIAEKIDLSNIDIVVIAGAQDQMSPEKFKIIQSFWEKYFLQCHGHLLDYSSGATSRLKTVFNP